MLLNRKTGGTEKHRNRPHQAGIQKKYATSTLALFSSACILSCFFGAFGLTFLRLRSGCVQMLRA